MRALKEGGSGEFEMGTKSKIYGFCRN